ncbi:TolC family protein [Granulicella sp. WH15]|uniref:TolC family protein n=1 Tax=Granulicella sp. WH15 TaxID=2602070 RepID=UPI0013A587B9|nr:TolC family protein [Granulicella sp. WH15]
MPKAKIQDLRSSLLPAAGLLLAVAGLADTASAQISLTSAVDLALSNSPRIKIAQSDVARAKASLEEVKDAYIPSVSGASSGAGYSSGFPLGTPTVFSVSAQSLVFSYSQKDYIRSADQGLSASSFALKEVREQVAEDTAVTYLTLTRDQQQRAALAQETEYAAHLEAIAKDRLDSGQDSAMEYTRARRTGVQLRLQSLQLDDAIAADADHLSRLIGVPVSGLLADPASIPRLPFESGPGGQPPAALTSTDVASLPDSAGVAASFATARARREQAFGDARYVLRPQISFGAQYSRVSLYNNAYVVYYPSVGRPGLSENAYGFALNITIPVLDAAHKAHARISQADAVHAEQQAILDRDTYREGRMKLQRSMAELSAHAELAALDRDLAQQQLDVLLTQLQAAPAGSTPPLTPKDEQNARILERQRYIEMLEAQFQLRQNEIHLLKQTGGLEDWLTSGTRSTSLSTTP